jgi:hypothetical protein
MDKEAQLDAIFARCDSTQPAKPRLEMKEVVCSETGRRIREFVGNKSVWMDRFKSPRYLQLRVCTGDKQRSEADQQRFEREWRETNAMLLAAERRG